MRKLLKRLGRRKLAMEASAVRERRGHRLGPGTTVGLLVPAADAGQRKQLKDLASGLTEGQHLVAWQVVADTGMTRKAFAKRRAQRIQKLGDGHEMAPEFPQMAQVSCFWRDDCGALGLPKEMPEALVGVDVLIMLDAEMRNLPLRAFLKRSEAPFKVGPMHDDDGTLDFMLTWPDGGDMLSFVQLAFHYLKTLDLK